MTSPLTVERVIVGVDFDAASAAAVRVAGAMADAFGVPLVAVHVATADLPAYFTQAQVADLQAEEKERRIWLTSKVREFAASYRVNATLVEVEEGSPTTALVRLVRRGDLLVVGTRRLKGPHRWWLGSVAEAVVRAAAGPVLVVPSAADETPGLKPGGSILVAAPPGDPEVEEWAAALGDSLAARIERTASVATCPAALIRESELIVVPIGPRASQGVSFDDVVHVLKECTHPVLFIPPASAEASSIGDQS